MTLNRLHSAFLLKVLVFVTASGCAFSALAQPAAELSAYLAKYNNSLAIYQSAERNVEFDIAKNGEVKLTFSDYSSMFILTEKSEILSESQEYFNSKLKIEKLEAYSLVPEAKDYKKISVPKFTRTHELSAGVFYDDTYSYVFNFPSVKQGCKLVTESEATVNDAFYPISFFFGNYLPVENAVLRLTFPQNVDIAYHLFGYDTADVKYSRTPKGKNFIHEWRAVCPKSYRTDEYSPSSRYFFPHVIVNITGYTHNGKYVRVLKSIDDLYAWDFSKTKDLNQTPAPEIKALADSLTLSLTTERQKVEQIYKWVQKNIQYVAIEDGENGFVPREALLVLQRRYGDCKDKSSLITALLRSIGLNASLAWVGTRTLPYKYSEFPSMSNANHMIAVWWQTAEKPVLLDGTTRYHRMDEIPENIQGKQCIIENGTDDYVLYTIPVALPEATQLIDTSWSYIDNGLMKGTGKASFSGSLRPMVLSHYEGVDTAAYKKILDELLPRASNKFAYKTATLTDLSEQNACVKIDYSYELPDYITSSGGSIYVNLNTDKQLNDIQLRPDRWIPLENDTPYKKRFVHVLTLPENTVAGNLPAPVSVSQPLFGFAQQYTQNGNTIILTTEITIDFQVIEGDSLGEFRKMINALSKTYTKSIVLTTK